MTITNVSCGECGVVFGMPETLRADLQASGRVFYCPNGHRRGYRVGKTEDQKTIERLQAQLRDAERSIGVWAGRASLFKCPMPRCSFSHKDKATLRDHLIRTHGSRLTAVPALAKDAGPSALNSNVGAK